MSRHGFSAASFRVRKDGVIPKKIDAAVKERAVRRVFEHRGEYASLRAAAAAVAKQERLGAETVRRWVLQAEVDTGHDVDGACRDQEAEGGAASSRSS